MVMALTGIPKLIEECGELQQVLGKRLAYWTQDIHPDGGVPLNVRMADEMGDVMAAIWFVAQRWGLMADVDERARQKYVQFSEWDVDVENNRDACVPPPSPLRSPERLRVIPRSSVDRPGDIDTGGGRF